MLLEDTRISDDSVFLGKPLNQYPHERVGMVGVAIVPQRTLAVQRFIHTKRLRYVDGENATLSSCHSDCQKEAGRGKKKRSKVPPINLCRSCERALSTIPALPHGMKYGNLTQVRTKF